VVKVSFADAGSREQLLETLRRIEQQADERLGELASMAGGPRLFPQRGHLIALTMRLQFDQEKVMQEWARWAQEQVAQWPSAADPGDWPASDLLPSSPASILREPEDRARELESG
jgi:hypothetical protein